MRERLTKKDVNNAFVCGGEVLISWRQNGEHLSEIRETHESRFPTWVGMHKVNFIDSRTRRPPSITTEGSTCHSHKLSLNKRDEGEIWSTEGSAMDG
jgi:hypothetical protein